MTSLQHALRARARRAGSPELRDEGAYAILFALLVVVLVGVVGFVLDTSLLRESRAATRSMADSAVVAAGAQLKTGTGWTPQAACNAGWAYLSGPIGADGSASCADLPATWDTTCPASPYTADWSNAEWRVVWTWPVAQNSPLMTRPDTEREQTQVYNAQVDGASACDRIAVEIYKVNQLGLSAVFGAGETTIRSASVARGIISGQVSTRIAALNILEETACNALTTTGGGTIYVGTTTNPGNVSVDSDGSTACGGQARVISPANATNNGIFVVGAGGAITSFALDGANADKSYNPALVPARLDPAPIVQGGRVTRDPVDSFYNCTGSCSPGGGNYIQSNVVAPYGSMSAATAAAQGFTVISGGACNVNNPTVTTGAKVYFDCGDLAVKAPLFLPQATLVVARGGIDVSSGGCFVLNAPAYAGATTATACPTSVTDIDNGTVSSDALVVLQNGNLTGSGTSQVAMRNTMTYLGNGYTDLSLGGLLYLTSPEGLGCLSDDDACRYGKFWKLTLWSEFTTSNKPFKYRGQSALKMRGVLFTPNGASDLAGGSGTQQNRAQFWTNTLNVAGGAAVVMDVDPDAAIAQPAFGSTLIR